ncbi:MAG: hypothetical protein JWO82_3684 [Akkermansiaceae bacterium]|nr:hypothetical protein [Akkermansiaceae bacterium]
MDPLEPWVDVAAVRRMAEQLMAASPLPQVDAGPDAGFGSDFIGYSPEHVSPQAVVIPPPPPPVAIVETPVVAAIPEPAPEPAIFPPRETQPLETGPAPAVVERRGPLLDRLGRFREGLVRYTSAQGVFILDREGKPVMDDASFGKLYFLARSLAQAYRPVAGQPGNVHVKINANLILEVIPVDTPFGTLVLGAVLSQPLSAQIVGEIATALRRAATPGESS